VPIVLNNEVIFVVNQDTLNTTFTGRIEYLYLWWS